MSSCTTPPAPPKDIEERSMEYDTRYTPLSEGNLTSMSKDVEELDGEGGRVSDEERGSEGTHSSQRSSEQDSIFNADNEGDEEDSSSESEEADEKPTLVG
ncbi:unnamed protein product, partial [Symbiodinium microadriaticum]